MVVSSMNEHLDVESKTVRVNSAYVKRRLVSCAYISGRIGYI
jgi:hypothetical protein